MVNDSEVKAQKSPFAMRINERKVFDGKDGYVSVNQVMFNVDMGYITDIHFEILEIINKFEFVTARQIFQLLLLKGVDVKSQDKVDDKLQKLIKTKVITRYYFTSEEGKGIFRVYCLEKMGKYLLASREIKSDWQQTNNAKPVHLIKKRLAGNQIIISYMQKVKTFESSNINAVLYSKKQNIKFKPTGGLIKLNEGNNSQNLVFEVVRRNDDWENKLVEKLNLYAEFYNFFVSKDCEFEMPPQLVIVAEDNEHIGEIFKIIKKSAIPLKDSEMFFTTELKHLADDLQNSLIEFQYNKDSNTYKGLAVKSDFLIPSENRIVIPKVEKKIKEEKKVEEVKEAKEESKPKKEQFEVKESEEVKNKKTIKNEAVVEKEKKVESKIEEEPKKDSKIKSTKKVVDEEVKPKNKAKVEKEIKEVKVKKVKAEKVEKPKKTTKEKEEAPKKSAKKSKK